VKGVFKPDETHWTNLMIDRTALLLPRLQRSEHASGQALEHMLHYLRIGLSVMHLRHCYSRAERDTAREINDLLYQLIHTKDPPYANALRQ
jgi:hypothetical protein